MHNIKWKYLTKANKILTLGIPFLFLEYLLFFRREQTQFNLSDGAKVDVTSRHSNVANDD